MTWFMQHWDTISLIAVATISEVIAVRQALKYPDNDGFGGILASLLKVFQTPKA